MKTKNYYILIAFSLSLSCGSETTRKTDIPVAEHLNDTLAGDINNTVSCTQKENKSPDSNDPITVKVCSFRAYKFVRTGYPDAKGRYTYHYELYQKQNGRYREINNSRLFNNHREKLHRILNQKIRQHYIDHISNPKSENCLDEMTPPYFALDEMGIEIDSLEMKFTVIFGLGGACRSIDGTSISIGIDEIQPYLQ